MSEFAPCSRYLTRVRVAWIEVTANAAALRWFSGEYFPAVGEQNNAFPRAHDAFELNARRAKTANAHLHNVDWGQKQPEFFSPELSQTHPPTFSNCSPMRALLYGYGLNWVNMLSRVRKIGPQFFDSWERTANRTLRSCYAARRLRFCKKCMLFIAFFLSNIASHYVYNIEISSDTKLVIL